MDGKVVHAIVRTDRLSGTDVRSGLTSFKYMGADGETPGDIDNGNVVLLEGLMEGEREIYLAKDVTESSDMRDVVLVADPELMYDERLRDLDDFYNMAGDAVRGFRLHDGDTFSITKEAFADDVTPAVDDIIELKAGTKLSAVKTATEGSTVVGKVIGINHVGKYTYYVVLVRKSAVAKSATPEPEKKQYNVPVQTKDVWSHKVSDLIADDIAIADDGKVTGTIHYMKSFTEFSNDTAMQQGNYFPVEFTCSGTTMVTKKNGSVSKTMAFDPFLIIRIPDKSIIWTVEVDSKEVIKLDFTGATLESAGDP